MTTGCKPDSDSRVVCPKKKPKKNLAYSLTTSTSVSRHPFASAGSTRWDVVVPKVDHLHARVRVQFDARSKLGLPVAEEIGVGKDAGGTVGKVDDDLPRLAARQARALDAGGVVTRSAVGAGVHVGEVQLGVPPDLDLLTEAAVRHYHDAEGRGGLAETHRPRAGPWQCRSERGSALEMVAAGGPTLAVGRGLALVDSKGSRWPSVRARGGRR